MSHLFEVSEYSCITTLLLFSGYTKWESWEKFWQLGSCFSTAAISSHVFNTIFAVLFYVVITSCVCGPGFWYGLQWLPRYFTGLDPDRFVGTGMAWTWLWRRSYTHHRLYEDLLQRRTGRKKTGRKNAFWDYSSVSDNSVLGIEIR
ncbi:uncharacterized protein K444DRAFT_359535 [Hyaloscypha bicolor E]|uniref:Uncharacterized protein n=1 Tax=Hyaloscypha bicolor E TaxID=1095630 RepID=A0A2J6TG16_9HELO|nr:uncharacterized protein K444DRAFT_359535 [Hyaloscypha bicolor E]PMD61963.1 hypothetical protein K444DRAFT_359535 [Hyaloscypha bicolor E]